MSQQEAVMQHKGFQQQLMPKEEEVSCSEWREKEEWWVPGAKTGKCWTATVNLCVGWYVCLDVVGQEDLLVIKIDYVW